jgi:hypothetical protein
MALEIVERLNDGSAFKWCYFEMSLVSLSMYRVIFFVYGDSGIGVETEASWACPFAGRRHVMPTGLSAPASTTLGAVILSTW